MLEAKKKSASTFQAFDCALKPIAPGTKARARMMRGAEWAIPGILSDILSTGLRRIQAFAQQQDSQRCVIEAAHLQNLPALLAEFNADALDRYWHVERPAFIQKNGAAQTAEFEPLWTALADVFNARNSEPRHTAARTA